MARPTDKERLLWLLTEHGGLTNPYLKSELKMEDGRYVNIVEQLVAEGAVERYRCRGGGVRLTTKGEKAAPAMGTGVGKEKDLYTPFCRILKAEASETGENAQVIDTSALRIRGKWSNPDVIKLAVRRYPLQRSSKLVLTTYELKQWGRWNVEAAFEAASQSRFAHESYVVLEWVKDVPVEGLEYMDSACARFGVGLIVLEPHYKSFRSIVCRWAEPNVPSEDETEDFLSYVLQRAGEAEEQQFHGLWAE